ncbi:conserved lipothrixviral protein [Sulfolobus islandicus filamentous virus 2]|uniref:Conserved lipothrixviral protein n=1 Tax=Sulfolobus islandicus filamentous virus 2 TaxID=1902331 RepID=A0A1D8BJB6_SIFV|nr:conserved lipothrixviral protein [Sulfolobus islandicus filamentous virus 2]
MRKLRADVSKVKPLSEIPSGSNLLWQNDNFALYYTYDATQGRVDWILVNKTNEKKYVSLLRGAELVYNNNVITVPSYIFGNAFADVYFANGLSSYISDLNNVPLYSLAVLRDSSGKNIVGFVFSLPPNGIITVPEYGFANLQKLWGQLLEAYPENLNLYVIIYDYAEIIEYEQETGVTVQAPPDPYAVFSYQFTISNVGTVMTQRIIIEIPQSDVNFANTLIADFKKFFSSIKHML